MHRARRAQTRALLAALLVAVAGCAKSKPQDKPQETPAPAPDTEAGAAPALGPKALLCRDGAHRRGDHWKVACNVCRCGADGDILCSQFPCVEVGPRDASAQD
jgi:hypothetical protein